MACRMPTMATEVPIPLAIIIADEVYQDRSTGKWVISGVFNQILGDSLPIIQDKMVIFWQATGIGDPVDLRLRIEHSDSGEPVFEVRGPIKAQSPLQVKAIPVRIRGIQFDREGKHWIQLLSGEEILIQAPLQITLTEQEPAEERTERESP